MAAAALIGRSKVPVDSAVYQSSCARIGEEVYTNDRHMLQAAKHFHVTGVNVLSESS